jgi:hypothetical protein
MTLPPTSPDDSRPVVLEEPERQLAPQWDREFTLQTEDGAPPALHPGWAQVLAEGEIPLWQGQPKQDRRFGSAQGLSNTSLPLLIVAGIFLMIALNLGFDGNLVPLVLIGLFFVLRRSMRSRNSNSGSDRRYLLTNRAAYLARAQGQGLANITAYPITPAMQLSLGPRSVSFATERDAKGNPTPVGFLDIPDAAAVHAIIRDLQKA